MYLPRRPILIIVPPFSRLLNASGDNALIKRGYLTSTRSICRSRTVLLSQLTTTSTSGSSGIADWMFQESLFLSCGQGLQLFDVCWFADDDQPIVCLQSHISGRVETLLAIVVNRGDDDYFQIAAYTGIPQSFTD